MSNDEEDIDAIWASIDDEIYKQSGGAGLQYNDGTYQKQFVLVEPNDIEPVVVNTANSEENLHNSAETLARKGNEGKRFNDPHSCYICRKIVSSRKAVEKHLERFHLKTTELICDLCPKIFLTRTDLITHMRTSHGEEKFACDQCDYKTANKHHLKSHRLIHAAKTKCLICKKQVSSLNKHMRCHKPKESCSICQKAFMPSNLKRHMNETHRIQKCDDCQESFESGEDLRRHKLRRHYEGKLHECHCGAVYSVNDSLRKHQKSHNDEQTTCDVCQKEFSSNTNLKFHRKTQHGQSEEKVKALKTTGMFICDKCGSKFSSRGSFQHHILAHRSPTIFCDLCPRSFTQKYLLANHIKRDHLKLRPFQCDVCQHRAFTQCHLDLHKLQHGSKTECQVCHKLVANMTKHLRSHIKNKCPICSKKFCSDSLRKHLKTHKKIR